VRAFAELYAALDETNKTNAKLALLQDYFSTAPAADAAWVLYFLSGRRPRRAISGRRLAEWAAAEAGLPDWLFGESYDAVGDIAETITLLLPETETASDRPLHQWVEERLFPLQDLPEAEQRTAVVQAWRQLSQPQRFIWNKLITGGFRVGVSQQLVARALAEVSGMDVAAIAHRLMGQWEPTADFYTELLHTESAAANRSRPYPFFLAYALEGDPEATLGDLAGWQVEWKWDGIRQVDRFVRANTREKFGPVRSVTPELVFELAFEAIQRSNRHKSGIAVRFPRILRWRHDKQIAEADTLARIRAMLPDGVEEG
jgi:DNA ligase-1